MSRQSNQTEIRRYLLGSLSDEEKALLEEKYFSDDAMFEEIEIAEDELIDRYVRGELSKEDSERFTAVVAQSPRLAERVEFARVWKDKLSGPVVRLEPVQKTIEPKKGWGKGAQPRPTSMSMRYLAIAASVVVLIGVGFFVWRTFIYEPPIERGLEALQAAYREQRPVEARLSGFSYAPLPNERGGEVKFDSLQRELAGSFLLNQAVRSPNAQSLHAVGQYHLYERQFGKAIEELTAALKQDPNNARINSDLGAALLEEGKRQRSGSEQGREFETFGRSLSHLTKAIEIDPSLLEARFNLAVLYQNMLPSQEADAWREYLKLDNTSAWAEEAKRNLARLQDNSGRNSWNSSASLARYVEAIEKRDDAAAWEVISQSYTSAGNEVANGLLDSLFADSNAQHHEGKTGMHALIRLAQFEAGRSGDRFTSDVVQTYEQATSKNKDLLAAARGHMRTGFTLFTNSRFSDAIEEYEQAKRYYQLCDDQAGLALSNYRLAHCYILLPDLPLARATLQRLVAFCRAKNYTWLHAQALYGMAHAFASSNEYSVASDYSLQALDQFETVGDLNGTLRCFAQLSDLNRLLKRVDRSLTYLSRGWALVAGIRAEPMQRWALLTQIAVNMTALDLHEAALLYHREALSIALEMARPLLVSRSYGYVGASYAALAQYDEAISQANRAFETGRTVPADGGREIMAYASLQLAEIHRQAGQCDKAIQAYDKSIELYEHVNQDYFSYPAHKGKLQCAMKVSPPDQVLALLRTVLDRSDAFRSKIRNQSERLSFFAAEQSVYDLAIRYEFVNMGDARKAFELAEASRARSLRDAIQGSGEISTSRYGPDLTQRRITNALPLDELQRQLEEGVQILQYAVLDDRVLMWVVTKDGIQHAESVVDRHELNRRVREYLNIISSPPAGIDALRPAEDLYRLLISPALRNLDTSKPLIVVPDKILNYLAFQALVSADSRRYLIEDFDISTAPSSSVFVDLLQKARSKSNHGHERLLAVGNPLFSENRFGSLSRLPAAVAEVRAITELYPTHRTLVDREATEAALRSEINVADVVHLAMHFVVDDSSEMQSGFPLTPSPTDAMSRQSDGFLQAHEIYNLRLPNTRLVVLSACQTGIEQQYDGEGAIGVARPFLVAGVPLVVASLWRVDSDAAAQLMRSFHRYRVDKLGSDAHDLKLAQIEMARTSGSKYQHPYYWAAFTAIGASLK